MAFLSSFAWSQFQLAAQEVCGRLHEIWVSLQADKILRKVPNDRYRLASRLSFAIKPYRAAAGAGDKRQDFLLLLLLFWFLFFLLIFFLLYFRRRGRLCHTETAPAKIMQRLFCLEESNKNNLHKLPQRAERRAAGGTRC